MSRQPTQSLDSIEDMLGRLGPLPSTQKGYLYSANSETLSNSFSRFVQDLHHQPQERVSLPSLIPYDSQQLIQPHVMTLVKEEPDIQAMKKRPHSSITTGEIISMSPMQAMPTMVPMRPSIMQAQVASFPFFYSVAPPYNAIIINGEQPPRVSPLPQSPPPVKRMNRGNEPVNVPDSPPETPSVMVHELAVSSPLSDNQEEASFRCRWMQCNEGFSTRTGLATHASTHLLGDPTIAARGPDDKSPIACQWGTCREHYATLKKLTKHLSRADHVGQTPFLSKTQEHEASKRRKKFACSFPGCNKSFTDSSNRKKHEHTHDVNRERFHCTEPRCTKSYTKRADLKVHLKIHRGEYPHKCTHPNCGKAFVRISELYTHERIHDNMRLHICDVCGKSFSETSRLKKHMAIHADPSYTGPLVQSL